MSKIFSYFQVLSLFFSISLYCEQEYKIEHVSLEQGISHNLIYSIYQDSKSIMWFGTMYGLVKYDGTQYTVYRYDALDSNSLSNDNIVTIYEDKSGALWFGSFKGGLNNYNRHTGKFTRYLHDNGNKNTISDNTIWAIHEDRNGNLWIGTMDGLNKFQNGQFTCYKNDSLNQNSISSNLVYSIAEDNNENVLWLGTFGGGLNKFDIEKNIFTGYKHNSDSNSISGNFIRPVYADKNGFIWAGAYGGGLNRFEKSTGKFKHYFNITSDTNSLSNNDVNYITGDKAGNLWVGVNGGVNLYNQNTGQFTLYSLTDNENKNEQNCIAVCEDKSGIIWLGAYYGGLYKLGKNNEKFTAYRHIADDKFSLANNNVRCVYEDKSSVLWIGTNDGLDKFDEIEKTFIHTNTLNSNIVNCVTEDSDGNLWIGTSNGLNKKDIKSGKYFSYYNNPDNNFSLSNNIILSLYTDKSGTIWAGTNSGLNKFVSGQNNFVRYKNNINDSESISDNTILSIYEDKSGYLWVGTYGGVNRMDKSTGKFIHYSRKLDNPNSMGNNYSFSFCEDHSGNFWIGTAGGLSKLNRESGLIINYNEKDGLPNGVIYGIIEDDNGNLWLSTNKGLSKFDVSNNSFKNFDTDDGLQSNMFNRSCFCKRKNGDFVFGGINGFNIFNPSKIEESKYAAPVILTSLTKFNGNEKKVLDISDSKNIELSYNENLITISYASIDYTNPKKNQYSYILEGFDKEWLSSGNVSKAVYANLNPGKYIFKVKGTNSDGVWNEQFASIEIIIIPPFWKTWWFYSAVSLVIILLIISIQNFRIKLRIKNLVAIEKAKAGERELVREQASRDYHDELGHKLTRISLYSRRAKKQINSGTPQLTEELNSIIETSNSLHSGAKDLIWALNPEEDTLYDASVRLKDFGNELFDNMGIIFKMSDTPDDFKNYKLSMNSKRHLIYIFKEGMNNILKYSECKNVSLEIKTENNVVEIILKDDGKGFIMNNGSKGYGLKNIASRAKQINGDIEIISKPEEGTMIRLISNI